MKKTPLSTVALLLTSFFSVANAYASTVCLEAKNSSMPSSDYVIYTLAVNDQGSDIYSLAGYITTYVDAISLKMKSLTNGSSALLDNKMEVSLTVTDIQDFPGSTAIEALMLGDTHMILDPKTLSGTYEAVTVVHPTTGSLSSSPSTIRASGTINSVACK